MSISLRNLKIQICFVFFAAAFVVFAGSPVWALDKIKFSPQTEIERYLSHTLQVEDPKKFLLHLKLHEQITNGMGESEVPAFSEDGNLTEAGAIALTSIFSSQSKYVLKKLVKSMGRSDYSNAMLVGPAGSGKTFVINQLVAVLSLGFVPDFLNEFLTPEEPSPFIESLKESFLKKTQVVSVDYDLLSRDNTRSGQAYAKSEVRMRSLLIDLFQAAKEDFKKKGVRTVFILEEVAQLPPLVQQTLKTLLDETGFKTPSKNPMELGAEIGTSVIGITTPGEYREMIGNDSAVERRYEYVYLLEPTEAEALDILINKKDSWKERYRLDIQDHVLAYVISMRSFFSNPPLAMPHSVLKVMDGLFLWATERANRTFDEEITVEDAYRYLIEQSYLPKATWIPQEENKPPLWDLQPRVQSRIVGHEKEVEQIVRRLKAGRVTGFSEVPVFIIMGPSGSGKDTLAKAINLELFGHNGTHLNFDVGGPQGQGLSPLINGTERELPKLIVALNEGHPHGVIVLNEAKGMPSSEFDLLKVLIETGIIRPIGQDSRARPLGLNILFIMGQYGEELLEGKTDQEVEEIVRNLKEEDLIRILMEGEKGGTKGAIPYAVIQRALKSGGIFFLKPSPESRFIDIARHAVKSIVEIQKVKSQIDLQVDDSVLRFVSDLAKLNKRGTRGLEELLGTFTSTAISEAYDKGLPLRGIAVRISLRPESETLVVEHLDLSGKAINTYLFQPKELLTSRCDTLLGT